MGMNLQFTAKDPTKAHEKPKKNGHVSEVRLRLIDLE